MESGTVLANNNFTSNSGSTIISGISVFDGEFIMNGGGRSETIITVLL